MMKAQLNKLRNKIDEVDSLLLGLLSRRGHLVKQVGQVKNKAGMAHYHVPEREALLIKKILAKNPGPYDDDAIQSIFREIISASLALEAPLNVAYLGPEGTFTHQAALKQFGHSANLVPQETIKQVFEEVNAGNVHYGLVPVENSTEGAVNVTLDLFMQFPLQISGELQIPIHHNLLSREKNLSKISKVYSHPQAISQCRIFLEKYLPHAKCVNMPSTASAAKLVQTEKNAAAIASITAAKNYALPILKKNIEDLVGNFTRFWVIGKLAPGSTGDDKTSIVFSSKDEVGILAKVLKVFADAKINLTKIESRPTRLARWEYVFFIDLDGHASDKEVALALRKVEKMCHYLKILGSYPQGIS